MAERDVLFFCSYCGDDNPNCSDRAPCADCLAMCNVYRIDTDAAVYVRQLAPGRPEANEWQRALSHLLMPIARMREPRLSLTRFNALCRLAGMAFLQKKAGK
jgi:hypothetical protein